MRFARLCAELCARLHFTVSTEGKRVQGMEHAKAEALLARQHVAAVEAAVERLQLSKADLATAVSRPVLDSALREMAASVKSSVTVRLRVGPCETCDLPCERPTWLCLPQPAGSSADSCQ